MRIFEAQHASMNAIFHRAKHWQLFTILIGTVFILQISMMLTMMSQISQIHISHRPPDLSGVMWVFFPMMLIPMGIIFAWQWSIGWGLRHKMPPGVRLKHKRFKVFTLFPIFYFALFILYMILLFSNMQSTIGSRNPQAEFEAITPYLFGMFIFLPLHFFAMFCIFYSYYFCAKTLKSIELGREAHSGDYMGYFFLFLFNIVGIWIIQPKVNLIASDTWTPPTRSFPDDPLDAIKPITPPIPPAPKEVIPRGERLRTKNHDAFNHDDDFDGIL